MPPKRQKNDETSPVTRAQAKKLAERAAAAAATSTIIEEENVAAPSEDSLTVHTHGSREQLSESQRQQQNETDDIVPLNQLGHTSSTDDVEDDDDAEDGSDDAISTNTSLALAEGHELLEEDFQDLNEVRLSRFEPRHKIPIPLLQSLAEETFSQLERDGFIERVPQQSPVAPRPDAIRTPVQPDAVPQDQQHAWPQSAFPQYAAYVDWDL